MKIAILGFAGQGKSAYEYWNTADNEITVCDSDESVAVPEGADKQLGEGYLQNLDRFDLLIRTPILHSRDIVAANPQAPGILDKVWSNTNEFFRVCPTKNIIGVTGTKGKGTTSTLIAKMLEASGKRVHLGGNIGIPPLELLKDHIEPQDYVVLELANFQLIDLKTSPHIAVCLMVEPEHMDWHTDMVEYLDAKKQLFVHQTAKDVAVYYAQNENSKEIAGASPGIKVPYMLEPWATVQNGAITIHNEVVCQTDELKLLGKHNWQNACAAATAVWQVTQDVAALRSVLTSFSGLPYRIEPRDTKNGVNYYNDSFATGPGACMAAMDAIQEMKVMIIGGYERGLDLNELADAVVKHASTIRKVVLIGATADRTAEALTKAGFTNFVHCRSKDMEEVVRTAAKEAEPGDAVVLSPGFASFDMFKSFEDRGNQFNKAVAKL